MGAIDVWKRRACPQTFCEDKRYGMTDLAPEVGLPKIEPESKWAALICTRNPGSNWTLIQAKPGTTIQHSCTPDTKLELKVGPDYSIETGPASGIGQHRIILVENFVNAPVDVITGKKHLGTTNANQALGKPFSFTPPLSAAVIQPSIYNVLNLTSILFIASGIWLGLLASFSIGNPTVLGVLAILALATIVSGVFLRKPKLWPATLGLAAIAVAFAAQLWIQFVTGLTAISKGERFPFEAVAYGRIGGQNVSPILQPEAIKRLEELKVDLELFTARLQRKMVEGDMTLNIPEGATPPE